MYLSFRDYTCRNLLKVLLCPLVQEVKRAAYGDVVTAEYKNICSGFKKKKVKFKVCIKRGLSAAE